MELLFKLTPQMRTTMPLIAMMVDMLSFIKTPPLKKFVLKDMMHLEMPLALKQQWRVQTILLPLIILVYLMDLMMLLVLKAEDLLLSIVIKFILTTSFPDS